jgi:hypothetical protein
MILSYNEEEQVILVALAEGTVEPYSTTLLAH